MKKKIGNIVLVLFIVVMMFYLLISAVTELTAKEEKYDIRVYMAAEALQLEHSINGLIPIGTDYYYVAIEAETNDAYIVKAPKNWLESNFDEDGYSLDEDGARITGISKKISSYEAEKELASRTAVLTGVVFPIGTSRCIDVQYKMYAIMKLVLVGISIILGVTGFAFMKKGFKINRVMLSTWITLLVIWLGLIIMVIR